MTEREQWLQNLKVGDPVVVHWLKQDAPFSSKGTVARLLRREIEVRTPTIGQSFGHAYKFRKSDGRRWPLNAYSYELWRIEPT